MDIHPTMTALFNRKNSGQAVVETVFAIVILTLVFALICSTCVYLYVQNSIVTAARMGARVAAVSVDLESDADAAKARVVNEVQDYFQTVTGESIPAGNIVTTGPTGATVGQRNVQVSVEYTLTNPLNVSGLGADATKWTSFPVSATATMRYEE